MRGAGGDTKEDTKKSSMTLIAVADELANNNDLNSNSLLVHDTSIKTNESVNDETTQGRSNVSGEKSAKMRMQDQLVGKSEKQVVKLWGCSILIYED